MPLKIELYNEGDKEWNLSKVIDQTENEVHLSNILDSGEEEMYLVGVNENDVSSYLRRVHPLSTEYYPLLGSSIFAYEVKEAVQVAELTTGEEIELFLKPNPRSPLFHVRLKHV